MVEKGNINACLSQFFGAHRTRRTSPNDGYFVLFHGNIIENAN
jgi:hypothetical protein